MNTIFNYRFNNFNNKIRGSINKLLIINKEKQNEKHTTKSLS